MKKQLSRRLEQARRQNLKSRRKQTLSVETLESRHLMAAAFFAPPEPTGSVNVQLVPLANVAAGTEEVVTFGVPFTRGSITAAQLSNVRVLKNGVEIPAFVEQLTPWRSIDDAAIDGQSVRVARIQIPYTFAALATESITVQWGGPARSLNRSTLQDPRLEWHTVTTGTFVAGDNVEEPDVLPVLPKEHLSKGLLDARTDPTSNAVAPTRDDPAVMDAMSFTGYTEFDYAQKNFFYTIINQNPGITVNYKTDPEPWLYDRASGMYELYLRSGFTTALREAVRATDFYADHINSSGFFTLKPGDTKYAYNESLAYTYWLMGDNRMLAPISTVVGAHAGTATRWNPNLSFWTERNVGYKLQANEIAYEVTGNTTFKNAVQTIVGDLIYHQNGANGQLPANRVDGGLYHIGEQHDASEVDDPNVIIASAWMSGLIVDPLVRVFSVWQNSQISDFVVRMGNFVKVASKTDANGQFGGNLRYPDYLMRADGTTENRTDTDVQHAMDVGAIAAWATYFAELRGTPDASLRQLANDLYATYDVGVNFWTRPGGTNFNVSPPRRYTWEYKNSPSFSWALTGSDSPSQPGTLQFSAANFSANETQATATITVTRNGGSAGAVSVNYATSNGTATAGSDYTNSSGVLTFAAGEISKTFTIPIINDSAVEVAETVTITLSNPTGGAALATPSSATLTIESDDSTNQPTTVTLQQGLNGYAGTTDVSITNQYAQYTGGNGSISPSDTQLAVFQTSGTNAYANESLIRFSDLGIPTNANVSGATLTLNVDTWSTNPTIRGYYVAAPWSVQPGTDLGWLHRGTGQDWNTPGALGQGTDVLAGKSFVLSGIQAVGSQFITVNLDPAVVQNWINNPSSNHGIILVNESTGAVVRVNASEQTNATLRPKLGVTYTVGTPTPQPGSLHLSGATYNVNENQGTATITVARAGGSEGSVTVNYATSNGTATAGSDYTTATGTLTFAAGEISKSFTIPIINDTLVEGNETITITLSSAGGGATLGSPATATLTIVSDDVATQPGSLQFGSATYAVNETGGTATITVTRSGGSDGAVSVNYATSNGTATAGSDYTATSGTLNFASGETTKTFAIPIINDIAVEGLETVTLTLSNPTGGATLGGQTTATLTITSDDVATQPGSLQFSGATYNASETNASVTITVSRAGGSDGAVSVNYATANGTATAGSDYTATSGTLNFAAGETTKTFTIPIINDSLVESPETVTLTLSNPTGGATLGSQANATLTITSDDTNGQPVTVTLQQGVNGYTGTTDVSISTQYAQYNQGNGLTNFTDSQMGLWQLAGTNGYSVENLIRFNNLGVPADSTVTGASLTLRVDTWASNATIRGYYVAAPWNATPGPNSTQLGWLHRGTGQDWATPGARGQGTDVIAGKSFVLSGIRAIGGQNITVNLDPSVVQIWINNPNANQGILLVNETTGAVVRINASEHSTAAFRPKLSVTYSSGTPTPQPGSLQLSNEAYTVNENGGTATITVTRTGGSDGAVSVNYSTSNGSATSGSDYTATTGTLNFAAGELSKTFTIPITNDTAVESSETLNVTLSNPTGGATLGSQITGVLTITDDDVATQPGSLRFSNSSYSLAENGGTLTVTVTRTGGTSGAVSVNYATTNGTATAGSDYTAASGTLSFANGETSKTFTIAVTDDSAVEASETVNLTLTNPTGGATLGSPATATFTITDNDTAPGIVLPAGFTQTAVATGIASGTALAVAPDGRIFVLEQTGAVRVIKNGVLLPTPAFTVPTVSESERGLLGITFDPAFATNNRVYVYYTVGGPSPAPAHNRISRFTLSGDVAVVGSETILMELPNTTYRIHNGGALEFGGDGKLYVAVGNDVEWNNAQDLTNPFGKILRINADGSIPTDNPFYGQTTGVNRAIWARGLRNPYTLDVQPGTGLMYINDVGEAAWEEINQGVAGANYGWPNGEGYTTNPQYTSPVYAYGHGSGTSQGYAIVGGAFYNPATNSFPAQYAGKYFFMDYVNGWISYVDPASPNPKTPTSFASNIPSSYAGGPVDLEVGPDGALYYLNRLGGGVFKIQYTAAPPPPPVGTFTNVTVGSGVGAIVNQKYQETPNWWLSGQHLIDLDNDNDLDLYLSNHGGGSVMALNNGNGVFTRTTTGNFPDSEIHQIYDINEDGKIDLSMTYQDGGGRWWLNNSTAGSVNFAATNITREGNTARSQVMLDFNGDGKVDWLRSGPPGLVVDYGNGSGSFALNSLTFSVPNTNSNNNASFLPADFDDDGDIDLLVLTGGGYDNTSGRTAYWRNNGNLTFTDITGASNIPLDGVLAKGIGDFDQDGDTDFIAVENKAMPPTIYLNNGLGVFTKKVSAITGVGSGSLDYSTWGTAISTDFDNDGIVDIIMNGKYYLKVLRGTGGGNFTYMNNTWGIEDIAASAVDDGLSFGDFDADGDLDIVGYDEIWPSRTLKVYRNDLAPKNYVNVRPVGLAGNKGAAGAKISIYAPGTNQLLWYEQVATYDFQVATSYYGHSETERHFGLGNRATVDVVVEFPSGHTTRTNNVAANQTIRVLESGDEFRSLAPAAPNNSEANSAGLQLPNRQANQGAEKRTSSNAQRNAVQANAVDLALIDLLNEPRNRYEPTNEAATKLKPRAKIAQNPAASAQSEDE
jgi:glucose/arabinose dehydrogenase/ribosomal protein L35AE/L33A